MKLLRSKIFNRVAAVAESEQRLLRDACDIHCHCLPGVDDGPKTMDAAVELCRALRHDGVTVVIATPHQLGRYEGRNKSAAVRTAVAELNMKLGEMNIDLTVLPGGDVRVDERTVERLQRDEILTLADLRKHVLLELPHELLLDLQLMIEALVAMGITPVMSHPERHTLLRSNPSLMWRWHRAGARFQVTADSVMGRRGSGVESAAWAMLESGVVDLIASDAHDHQIRFPRLTQAFNRIADRVSVPFAHRICVSNPRAIVIGDAFEPLRAA